MTPSQAFRHRWRTRRQKALISVHRGLWGAAPENSHPAVLQAAKLGIVEIDVQMSRDGIPVVLHDATLERMAGVAGRVADLDAATIMSCRLREGAGGPGCRETEERVPTFGAVLDAAPAGAFFDFDVKHPDEVEAVAAFIAGRGAQHLGSVKIDTTTGDDIERLLDLERRYGVMVMAKVILPQAGADHIAALAGAGVAAAEVWFGDLDELSRAAQAAGTRMAISTYTLDPVHCCGLSDSLADTQPGQVWGRLIDAGVTVIMTDRAARLGEYLETL